MIAPHYVWEGGSLVDQYMAGGARQEMARHSQLAVMDWAVSSFLPLAWHRTTKGGWTSIRMVEHSLC